MDCDCDQTAMGLPLVMSAVFLTIYVKRGRLGAISEMPLLPLRGLSVSGMYVCISLANWTEYCTLKNDMSLIFKNDARFIAKRVTTWLFFKNLLTHQ
jgi:hypothetical protein